MDKATSHILSVLDHASYIGPTKVAKSKVDSFSIVEEKLNTMLVG
jgi:hypothetical protein